MATKKPAAKSSGQAKSRRVASSAAVPSPPQIVSKKIMVVGPTGKRRMAREDEVNKK